ncbi:MAG: hypothetical protein SGARI_004878, partial [Bacillariaceae sp.]
DISLSGNCLSIADRYCAKNDVTRRENYPKKRRVTFSDNVSSVETEHVNDISCEDQAKRWLCLEDFYRTKMDVLDHLKICKHFGWPCCGERTFVSINGETATISMRGIRSDLESQKRRQDQQATTKVVLNEQLLQRSEGVTGAVYSPEVIAMLYHLLSFSNQRQALERGLYDAVCVYGNSQNYHTLGAKHALFEEGQSMESDTMQVDEGLLRQLMAREHCHGHATSVEDWLFERYQRGQRVATAYCEEGVPAGSPLEHDVPMVES